MMPEDQLEGWAKVGGWLSAGTFMEVLVVAPKTNGVTGAVKVMVPEDGFVVGMRKAHTVWGPGVWLAVECPVVDTRNTVRKYCFVSEWSGRPRGGRYLGNIELKTDEDSGQMGARHVYEVRYV